MKRLQQLSERQKHKVKRATEAKKVCERIQKDMAYRLGRLRDGGQRWELHAANVASAIGEVDTLETAQCDTGLAETAVAEMETLEAQAWEDFCDDYRALLTEIHRLSSFLEGRNWPRTNVFKSQPQKAS